MAASNVENSFRVAPLTESNYAAWLNTMKLCLQSISAWRFIEGAVETPKDADASLFYRASTIIVSNVGPELSYLVLTSDEVPESSSPYRLWTNIEAHFVPRSSRNLAKLKCQFFSAKIEEGEEVAKFIARVNALASQLNVIIGKGRKDGISKVTEGDRMAVIVEGIESAFPEAYNALNLVPNLSYEQMVSFVNANCVRSKSSQESQPNMVNHVRRTGSESAPKKKCSHCGRSGHTAKYCYDLHPELREKGGARRCSVFGAQDFPIW